MVTVIAANSIAGAVDQFSFITRALNIVKPDWANSLTKEGKGMSSYPCNESNIQ